MLSSIVEFVLICILQMFTEENLKNRITGMIKGYDKD